MAQSDRSLEALGLAGVPALDPLSYPGSLVSEPGLLHDSEYLALRPSADRVGDWKLESDAAFSLDDYLAGIDQPLVPRTSCDVYITWFDSAQLEAVDATEYPEYRRILIASSDYPMDLPSAERVDVAYLYVNTNGVLTDPDGSPMIGGEQRELLMRLLARSAKLNSMFGSAQEWVERAGSSAELRAEGLSTFREENWILCQDEFLAREPEEAQMDLVYGN